MGEKIILLLKWSEVPAVTGFYVSCSYVHTCTIALEKKRKFIDKRLQYFAGIFFYERLCELRQWVTSWTMDKAHKSKLTE
jgi:hypothetical protein